MTSEDSDPSEPLLVEAEAAPKRRWLGIALRVLGTLVALTIAGFVLNAAFDDLDFGEVINAARALDDAQRFALISGTLFVVFAEALLTAGVVEGMPARRGALAWLVPTATASVLPGPSDVPVRYRMFTSWGYTASVATTAVAVLAVLNIGLKLVLPAIAGVGIAVADLPIDGFFSTIVTMAVLLAVFIVAAIVTLGSESRTEKAGRFLEKIWRATMRLLRREPPNPRLAERLVEQRAISLTTLQGRWIRTIASLALVTITRVALFVMCLRFVGVPESAVSWPAVFCVWAIVRGLTIIPIMPGGAGISEVAFVGLLVPITGTEFVNEVTAGVLLFRVLTWLVMIPAGGVAFGIWQVGVRRARTVEPNGGTP